MAEAARNHRPASYADIEALPPHLVGELIAGELVVSPRPALRHARAASRLGAKLGGPFDLGEGGGPGGWQILDEPELHLGPHVLVPDIAGWRRERLPALPDEAYFSLAPDWLCEVLSPSTASLDRAKKLRIYAQHRVSHAWLVDPGPRTLEVLRLEGGRWTILATHVGDEVVRAEPFAEIEVELSALWGD